MGGNLLQDLVAEEVRLRERLVAIDDEAVLLSPYAARLPYQLLLAPRRPRARFEDDGPLGAALLHDGLNRLGRVLGFLPPLNIWVRTAPRGAEHFCWRIDILPRLDPPRRAGARHRRAPQHRRARAGGGASCATREPMRALIQRVRRASVTVDGEVVAAIEAGLLVLLGVTHDDDEAIADRLADKVAALRIFEDADGKMNESLGADREVLVVSQFTLYGDGRKGNRPSFVAAARPEHAEPLYERFARASTPRAAASAPTWTSSWSTTAP